MEDKQKSIDKWYILPEYVDIHLLASILPFNVAEVARYCYSGAKITCVRLLNIPLFFTIAETQDERFINGMYDLTPIGHQTLPCFLQVYWRYLFEDILTKEGYYLKHGRPYRKDDGSYLMLFYKDREG